MAGYGHVVGGGGISAGFVVDTEALREAVRKSDRYMRDLRRPNMEAAKVVKEDRNRRVPELSGHLKRAARSEADTRTGRVRLAGTGYGSNDYIGVAEFGGMIPRYQGQARRKTFTDHKDRRDDGYFLYPAKRAKTPEVQEQYDKHVKELIRKYFP